MTNCTLVLDLHVFFVLLDKSKETEVKLENGKEDGKEKQEDVTSQLKQEEEDVTSQLKELTVTDKERASKDLNSAEKGDNSGDSKGGGEQNKDEGENQ